MTGEAYLRDIIAEFRGWKAKAERCLAQVSDEAFFSQLDPETNSTAIIVKHLAGNFRSRWREPLTTDGEKPDRNRDTEFELTASDTRDKLMSDWTASWDILLNTLESFSPEDLTKTIVIRTEDHTVPEALHRSVTHTAEHIGQIILLAKHFSGASWQTLSIARGKSREFNRRKGLPE